MHHALRIEEILFNIFGHHHPVDPVWTVERNRSTADLAALARTCRTFREPALDVLWSELIDLSPLAFCLPERHQSSGRVTSTVFASMNFPNVDTLPLQCYSFAQPRSEVEWDTLRSYTRRVWRIISFSSSCGRLDPSCISTTFNLPLARSLFPNLRFLRWQGGTSTLPVVHFAVPMLTCLDIRRAPREDVSVYTSLLDTLVPQCPNIRKIRIQVANDVEFGETVHRYLRSWNKLQVVDCLDVALPCDVIPHLSSVSTLQWLSFTLNARSPTSIIPLPLFPGPPPVFTQLVYLEIVSESLESVARLVARVRLPAVQVLIVPFANRPLKETVTSYLSTLCEVCSPSALTDLRLLHLRSTAAHVPRSIVSNVTINVNANANADDVASSDPNLAFHNHGDDEPSLDIADLRPCMTFTALRAVHVNLELPVDLNDVDVLALVSAWPHIEHFVINDRWGWHTTRGITLDGLGRMLRGCPALWEVCIALDTEVTDSDTVGSRPLDVDLSSRKHFRLNVADSVIRHESVPVLRRALSTFDSSRDPDRFSAWNGSEMGGIPGAYNYGCLWKRVFF